MKKYTGLFIVLIFVLTGIIIAVSLAFRLGTFKRMFSNAFAYEEVATVEEPLESFKDISIDADIMSFEIARGDDYHVEYRFPGSMLVKCTVDDDTLKITAKGKKNSFNIKNAFSNENFKMIVYVPKNAAFGKLEGNIDAGDFRISDAVFEEIDLDMDAANTEFSNITVGDIRIVADAGNIEINDSVTEDLTVETDAGNAELSGVSAQEINVTTEMGNIEFKNVNFDEGSFESQLGNIEVKGTFNKAKAECSMGAISINPDNPDEAKIEAEVDLGSIKISGKQISGRNYKN